ncbi:hypothetical protein AKJ45_01280 [candidate division MSBL1 archaeon SCGC-AAA261F19]|uniref:Uncharacterized protein n=1 Tax=candidate division MSBL1 archaeon SCGC-AAA261F19 TaxID=1698275 RepID=A0A133VAV1_9EURY|nr:hypothetical protein AKJ45_01280 [candidate division MSBL1 archaeon SCGC-AAA261F19]
MGEDIVTSFRVNEDLWKKARVHAIKNDTTMKEILETLLKVELKENIAVKRLNKEGESED